MILSAERISEIREAVQEEISERESRLLDLPRYSRDGLIPGWDEVVGKFNLNKLHPRDFSLLRGYYRAQRRLAEGRPKKARKIFKALDGNPDFQSLEERNSALLTGIADFVRRPSERGR